MQVILLSQPYTHKVSHYRFKPILNDITGKPSSFTPSSHTHDDRYYTESEVNSKLAGKADSSHSHSWSSITSKPTSFTPSSHSHDDRYYTETEIDDKLAGKANSSHAHSWGEITGKPSTFAPSSHGHAWGDISGKPAQATRWPSWSEVQASLARYA